MIRETDLVVQDEPRNVGLVRLVDTPEQIAAAWAQFQDLKRQLLTPNDYQEIQGRQTVKKSGWRKLGAAFGVSTELIREERVEYGPNHFGYDCWVRAIAPNGRHADGIGSCDNGEPRFARNRDHQNHDVRATAYTRAANRAVSDLIGGGEVSAEEMDADAPVRRQAPPRRPASLAPPAEAVDPDGPPSDQQRAAIAALLKRTGRQPSTIAQEIGIVDLDTELTRELAAEAIRRLSREPNAQ